MKGTQKREFLMTCRTRRRFIVAPLDKWLRSQALSVSTTARATTATFVRLARWALFCILWVSFFKLDKFLTSAIVVAAVVIGAAVVVAAVVVAAVVVADHLVVVGNGMLVKLFFCLLASFLLKRMWMKASSVWWERIGDNVVGASTTKTGAWWTIVQK